MLLAAGWQPESNLLHASHYTFGIAAGRRRPTPMPTGASASPTTSAAIPTPATDAAGKPTALAPAALAQIFGTFNGVPPTRRHQHHQQPESGRTAARSGVDHRRRPGALDYNVDGAICHRNLWTGTDANAARVQAGVAETLRTANLHGKPAIIVAGRADAQVPVNFNARPYFGAEQDRRRRGEQARPTSR